MRKPLANYLTDRPVDDAAVGEAGALTKPELVETILAVIDVEKGDRTRLMKMRKYDLTIVAAKLAYEFKRGKGPRLRKPVKTRWERQLSGTRKHRRDCTKARKHRALESNYHHKIGGR